MARPRKEINKTEFEKLCGLQCTLQEIAGFFDCSEDTIERFCKREYRERFADVYDKKRGIGKISIRRYQFKLAEKSAAMAIFLGKNYLGQSDHVVIEDRSALEKLDEILKGTQENAERMRKLQDE